jgi:thiol-disulfide isomerase/thioredoxin
MKTWISTSSILGLLLLVGGISLLLSSWSPLRHSPPARILDLDGQHRDPLAGDTPATVLVFTRTDCPISNRYAPELERLAAHYGPRGVHFWMIYVDPEQDAQAIRRHQREYSYTLPALIDLDHALVELTAATVTPEAAVFNGDNELVYRGRIDDRYVDFGKARPQPRQRDLQQVLDAVLAGHPVGQTHTQAVGCYIADLKN